MASQDNRVVLAVTGATAPEGTILGVIWEGATSTGDTVELHHGAGGLFGAVVQMVAIPTKTLCLLHSAFRPTAGLSLLNAALVASSSTTA